MATLYPSLLASNQLTLQTTLEMLDPYVSGYHLDIMDHHFVPNLAGSPDLIHAIAAHTHRQLWIHLMVTNPEAWPTLLEIPAESIVTFHLEATKDPLKIIHAIKRKGWQAGIALKPTTPVDQAYPLLPQIDQLLLMSVEPGFSGQKFLPGTIEKITAAYTYKTAHNVAFHIAVDGGITYALLPTVIAAGAQDIALGSALFKTENPADTIQRWQENL